MRFKKINKTILMISALSPAIITAACGNFAVNPNEEPSPQKVNDFITYLINNSNLGDIDNFLTYSEENVEAFKTINDVKGNLDKFVDQLGSFLKI
jgi:hypothetical protein